MKKIYTSILAFILGMNAYTQEFTLEEFATGFSNPVEIVHAGDDRLFVVEQAGRIIIVNPDGSKNTTPFLNISNQITSGGERGLLGLAFDPNYQTNGRFYVNYTDLSGNTAISRFTVSADPNVANPTGEVILHITQPFSNHNGDRKSVV